MSVIITFMFEPAKLQMNWAKASGTSIFRSDGVKVWRGAELAIADTPWRRWRRHQLCSRFDIDRRPSSGHDRTSDLNSNQGEL
jgi:hypothetical protein